MPGYTPCKHFGSLSLQAETRGQCAAHIGRSRANLAAVQNRFRVGELTRTDVAEAELDLALTGLNCHLALIDKFCASAPHAAADALAGTIEEARVGQRSEKEIEQARQQVNEVDGLCK